MNKSFHPGQVWLDAQGKAIQAHGGGILFDRGVYYWYGEDKSAAAQDDPSAGRLHRLDVIGVHCYSSTDLYNWNDEGLALPAVKDDPSHDLHPSKVAERPKVIFNALTGKYVMWLHVDSADYAYARAGVAISDAPTGPFTYLGSLRPNGAMSRDMTLFQDDDGQAYHIFSSEDNSTMHISLLSEDYLSPSGKVARIFEKEWREAPAILKHAGRYHLVTSACTGWDPNPAGAAWAESIFGPWQPTGNPCVGPGAELTFLAQSTFALPVAGKAGAFILMFDRWNKHNLSDSRYVWLPVTWEGEKMEIAWREEWDLSAFENSA